jgi:DNA-binding XRE family transcriptional regulator
MYLDVTLAVRWTTLLAISVTAPPAAGSCDPRRIMIRIVCRLIVCRLLTFGMWPRADAKSLQQAFGRAIRQLRDERGISQERLAELAGLHRTYVGSVERGERNVSLVNIHRLAKGLGLDTPRLMAAAERRRHA